MRSLQPHLRPVALAIHFIGAMIAVPEAMAANQDTHPSSTGYDGIRIEHAEFIPFGPDSLAGYLTIWNGTPAEKTIRSIEVESFGKAEIARRVSDDVVRSILGTAGVMVPPNSELHMDLDTVFVLLNRQELAKVAEVTVRFEDGSEATVEGRFVDDSSSLTDHHHPSGTTR